MRELPLSQIFIYSFATVAVAVALGVVTYLYTHNVVAMTVVMGLATAVGLVFMSRWWISVNRARGIPAQMPARTKWLGGALLFAAVGAIIAIEYAIYGFTNSRIAEAVVAIMFALPIGFFALPAFYQKMRPVMPIETKTWRMNYIMQIVLFVVFACNLVLMLLPKDMPN